MEVFWLSILTFVASLIGTLAGFGSSTIMLPIVAIFFPLPIALLFVAIVHFFNDLWEILLFKHKIDKRLFFSFAIPGILTSYLGAKIVINYQTEALYQILGALLVGYVVFIHFVPKFEIPKNIYNKLFGGGFSGIIAGLFGIAGPVQALFLSAQNLEKAVYLSTLGAIAMVTDAVRISTYYSGGTRLESNLWYAIIFLIPVSFVAAEIAKKFVDKISQTKFRQVVSVFLLIIGIKLIVSPL